MNSVFRFTIAISLFIHLTVYMAMTVKLDRSEQPFSPKPLPSMEFVLAPPLTPTPSEPVPPPSKHMEDDIQKANTSNGLADTASKQTPKPQGQDDTQLPQDQPSSQVEEAMVLSSSLSSFLQQAIKNVKVESIGDNKDKKKLGEQLEELDDSALDDTLVESPLKRIEEEKARWRNEILKRISEQVNFVWVKPEGSHRSSSGVIRMDIDAEGYLKSAWVHLPSGDASLDASILRAIRSVWHFQIPKSDKLNRYYRHLEFHYSGGHDTG